MDNFTLAVLVGGVMVLIVFTALLVLDKKNPKSRPADEPTKARKRSA